MFSHLMSDFLKHAGRRCAFAGSGAWVVLSEIEQSIKRKIEAVGKPLRDWDVSINYGIKTGFNDAFIVTTQKRDEILASCRTDEEREKTSNIIRPILRGRDIKRYSYEWADLWLIATFPSMHYDIEQYPAIKEHLLSFGMERLEQTGKEYVVDGQHIKARKKTNNKWFETQDSISYVDFLSQHKIVWKRVGSILRFSYDENQFLTLDSTCFAVGKNIEYICCVLNSSMGHYLLKDAPQTGTGDLLISVQAIEPLRLPIISEEDDSLFIGWLNQLILSQDGTSLEQVVLNKIFDLYGLTPVEREFIKTNFS